MPRVLAVMAHPDDIEITCAGTLVLLRRAGWDVHMATMTAGDLGSRSLTRSGISRVRLKEAAASAALLGAGYTCLGSRDLLVAPDEATKRRVTALVRKVRPDLILAPSPEDYMDDHRLTPQIVREAAFASTIPNWEASLEGESPPCAERVPSLLYADPIGLEDFSGRRVPARIVVDITRAIEEKSRMLAAHASQRDWLRAQHGEDEYLLSMRRWAADRARDFRRRAVKYAEGFNPHLGHGFPREDVLSKALGKKIVRSFAPGAEE